MQYNFVNLANLAQFGPQVVQVVQGKMGNMTKIAPYCPPPSFSPQDVQMVFSKLARPFCPPKHDEKVQGKFAIQTWSKNGFSFPGSQQWW